MANPKPVKQFKEGNPGRKKGSKNRTTREAEELFMQIMAGEVDNVKDSLHKVRLKSPYNYLRAMASLMPYFIPKKTDITSGGETIKPVVIDWSTSGNDSADAETD